MAIETRKDQLDGLEWQIKPRDRKDTAANAADRIKALTEFWSYPDGYNEFAVWLRKLIEDVLVTDAPALEIMRNRGGDVIGLDYVDGSTIKVLLDETGRRPRPPAPAYEQVIHGRPWAMLEDGSRIDLDEGEVVNQFEVALSRQMFKHIPMLIAGPPILRASQTASSSLSSSQRSRAGERIG